MLVIVIIIILGILYTGLVQEGPTYPNTDYYSVIESAVNTPNGTTFSRKNVSLTNNFETTTLRNKFSIHEDCFKFQSDIDSTKITENGSKIEFISRINTNIYATCSALMNICDPLDSECCEMSCIIEFKEEEN